MATIYRSTDAGAPAGGSAAGGLIEVLRACLVDGYTGKSAAGWSVKFEDAPNHLLALQNSTLFTGSVYRFDDSQTGHCRMRGYSDMSDIDTGTNATPSVADRANGLQLVKHSSWIVVADSRTAWVSINNADFYGFGDFDSALPSDGLAWFVSGDNTGASSSHSGIAAHGADGFASITREEWGQYIPRNLTDTDGPVKWSIPNLYNGRGANSTSLFNDGGLGGSAAPMVNPSPGSSKNFFIPAVLGCEGTMRGTLRGLYVPLNNIFPSITSGDEISGAGGIDATSIAVFRAVYGSLSFGRGGALGVALGGDW